MFNPKVDGQDGRSTFQMPPTSVAQSLPSSPAVWFSQSQSQGHGFLPVLPQFATPISSLPVHGQPLLGQQFALGTPQHIPPPSAARRVSYSGYNTFPTYSMPPPNFCIPSQLPSDPAKQTMASFQEALCGVENPFFIPEPAKVFEASSKTKQSDGDLALETAAARAALNGILMEAPPCCQAQSTQAEVCSRSGNASFNSITDGSQSGQVKIQVDIIKQPETKTTMINRHLNPSVAEFKPKSNSESDRALSTSSQVVSKMDKSCQTERLDQQQKKISDKIINLQAEVCRLRAQLCLNELHRQRFHQELDIFLWRSTFQPVTCGITEGEAAAQNCLRNLLFQIKQIETQRDYYLDILKSGKELLALPSFTLAMPIVEVVKDVDPLTSAVSFVETSISASQLRTPVCAGKVIPLDQSLKDEGSCTKKQRLKSKEQQQQSLAHMVENLVTSSQMRDDTPVSFLIPSSTSFFNSDKQSSRDIEATKSKTDACVSLAQCAGESLTGNIKQILINEVTETILEILDKKLLFAEKRDQVKENLNKDPVLDEKQVLAEKLVQEVENLDKVQVINTNRKPKLAERCVRELENLNEELHTEDKDEESALYCLNKEKHADKPLEVERPTKKPLCQSMDQRLVALLSEKRPRCTDLEKSPNIQVLEKLDKKSFLTNEGMGFEDLDSGTACENRNRKPESQNCDKGPLMKYNYVAYYPSREVTVASDHASNSLTIAASTSLLQCAADSRAVFAESFAPLDHSAIPPREKESAIKNEKASHTNHEPSANQDEDDDDNNGSEEDKECDYSDIFLKLFHNSDILFDSSGDIGNKGSSSQEACDIRPSLGINSSLSENRERQSSHCVDSRTRASFYADLSEPHAAHEVLDSSVSSVVSGADTSRIASAEFEQQMADNDTGVLALDGDSTLQNNCGLDLMVMADEAVAFEENIMTSKPPELLSEKQCTSCDVNLEPERKAEVSSESASDACSALSSQTLRIEARLEKREINMFAVESDSDDDVPTKGTEEEKITQSVSSDSSVANVDKQLPQEALGDADQLAASQTAAATSFADVKLQPGITKDFVETAETPSPQLVKNFSGTDPPLLDKTEVATLQEEAKDNDDVEHMQAEMDREQVLTSVTERLKELYPKESMDQCWLQDTAEEQTELFLQQLHQLEISSEESTAPSAFISPSPDSMHQSLCSVPAGEQSSRQTVTLQSPQSEVNKQPFKDPSLDADCPPDKLCHPEKEQDQAATLVEIENLIIKKEEVLSQQRQAMAKQTEILEKAAVFQQAFLTLHQDGEMSQKNLQQTEDIEHKLKQYQILLDEAEQLGEEIARFGQEQQYIELILHSHQQNVQFSAASQMVSSVAQQRTVGGSTSAFVAVHTAHPHSRSEPLQSCSSVIPTYPTTFQPISVTFSTSDRMPLAFPVTSVSAPFSSSASIPSNSLIVQSTDYASEAPVGTAAASMQTSRELPNLPRIGELPVDSHSLLQSRTSAFKPTACQLGDTSTQVSMSQSKKPRSEMKISDFGNIATTTSAVFTFSAYSDSKAEGAGIISSQAQCHKASVPVTSAMLTTPSLKFSSCEELRPRLPLKPIISNRRYVALSSVKDKATSEENSTDFASYISAAVSQAQDREITDSESVNSKEKMVKIHSKTDDNSGRRDMQDHGDWQASFSERFKIEVNNGCSQEVQSKKRSALPVDSRSVICSDLDSCNYSLDTSSAVQHDKNLLSVCDLFPPAASNSRSALIHEKPDSECDPVPLKKSLIFPSSSIALTSQASTVWSLKMNSTRLFPPPGFADVKEAYLDVELDTPNSQSTVFQLDDFTFSKTHTSGEEVLCKQRPVINKVFLGRLVENNRASNRRKETSSGDATGIKNAHGKDRRRVGSEASDEDDSKNIVDNQWQLVVNKKKRDHLKGLETKQTKKAAEQEMDPKTTERLPPKVTAYKKLCLSIEKDFPNLKPEDIQRVIEKVKQSYGGHFHGRLFSGILKDIRMVVLRDFPNKLRSSCPKPVFTKMNVHVSEKETFPAKKSEEVWRCCGRVLGMSFKASEDECSICLMEFCPDSRFSLECGHTFHKWCIDKWVKERGERTCPLCRKMVLTNEDFPRLGQNV